MNNDLRALLIDSVTDYAIFALDSSGYVSSWNPGAQKLKGYTANEIIGRHFSCFYTDEDQEAQLPQRLLNHARETGRVEAEGWRVRKDGKHFWASVFISAIHDQAGVLRGFAKVTRDLTDRKNAEETRLRMAQLQEAARVRDEFLAYVSHEMRTPLSTIQLQLELLRKSDTPLALFQAEPLIERLQRSYDRLAELVDSLLEQAKVHAGRISLQRTLIDLADVAASVMEEFIIVAENKGLALVFSAIGPNTKVYSDEKALRVILSNLIGNAIKFSQRGTIAVTVSADEKEHRIAVRDEGPGIAPEDQLRIFEPFERIESLEHKHTRGFGLGLASSKKLSEALGSRIEVESSAGAGSTFSLIIPAE